MENQADLIIMLIVIFSFFMVVGIIQALLMIGLWVLGHYKRVKGLERW
jgi:hypothetical protein